MDLSDTQVDDTAAMLLMQRLPAALQGGPLCSGLYLLLAATAYSMTLHGTGAKISLGNTRVSPSIQRPMRQGLCLGSARACCVRPELRTSWTLQGVSQAGDHPQPARGRSDEIAALREAVHRTAHPAQEQLGALYARPGSPAELPFARRPNQAQRHNHHCSSDEVRVDAGRPKEFHSFHPSKDTSEFNFASPTLSP